MKNRNFAFSLSTLLMVAIFDIGCGGEGIDVKKVIDADGGIIRANNGLTVWIPARAVDGNPITVEIKTTSAPSGDFTALSDAYQFLPSPYRFQVPIVVSMPFKSSTGEVRLFWSKYADDSNFDLNMGTVSEDAKFYQAFVDHFSKGFVGLPANPIDGGTDAGIDAGTDAGAHDGGMLDGGQLQDAGEDAGADAGIDAGFDAGGDAGAPDGGILDGGQLPDAGPVVLTWIQIPAGSYQMGCSPGDTSCEKDESFVHIVNVPTFKMMEHEVTQGEYLAVIGTNPAYFTECGLDCPVERVDWNQAKTFCTAVGGRLPSESEWEYAARGGTATKWYCGDDEACVTNIAWYGSHSGSPTHIIKTKTANSYGLYDMSGNVWEWVEDDYHSSYTGAPTNGSAWICTPTRCTRRVKRGGCWLSDAWTVRSSLRATYDPGSADYSLGFRCSRD